MSVDANYTPFDLVRQTGLVAEPGLSSAELNMMFAGLLRCPSLRAEASRQLRSDYFDSSTEPHYGLLWSAAQQLLAQYNDVSYEALVTVIQSYLSRDAVQMPRDLYDLLLRPDWGGIIYWAMYIPADAIIVEMCRELLRRFLQSRRVFQPLQTLLSSAGGANVEGFSELLRQAVAEIDDIRTLQVAPVAGGMPSRGAPLPPPVEYLPTGLAFVDDYIIGQRRGDCNAVLGNFGSGKTTFAVQLAVRNAEIGYALYCETRKREITVLVTYEEPEEKMNPRIWSAAAKIPREKLDELTDWSTLTTRENLAPYERDLHRQLYPESHASVEPLSETERWDMAAQMLNTNFLMLDMSGSGRFPNAGKGHVDEIVAALERLLTQYNATLRCVVIDYAGLLCRRYMSAKNINEDKMRHYLTGLADDLRRKISEHFRSVTWVMHQFAGDQGKKSPTTRLHHTDAAESKSFGENMAVCGCLGTVDPHTGCLLMNWSKVRYAPGMVNKTPPVLQIAGQFSKLVQVHTFVPDAAQHKFLDTQTANTINGRGHNNPRSSGPPGLRSRGVVDVAGDGYVPQ